MDIKRIAVFTDISGVGKSSMTTAVAVLSAAGFEVCPCVTGVFSTVTGYFNNPHYTECTTQMQNTVKHWKYERIPFYAAYSGFLTQPEQWETVAYFFEKFQPKLKLVDPSFADDNKIYSCFTESIILAQRELCKLADVIVHNQTESKLLAMDYNEHQSVVTTGAVIDNKIHNTYLSPQENGTKSTPHINQSYPGTGDLFASVLMANLLHGKSLGESVNHTVEFVYRAVETTFNAHSQPRYGVQYEHFLKNVIKW